MVWERKKPLIRSTTFISLTHSKCRGGISRTKDRHLRGMDVLSTVQNHISTNSRAPRKPSIAGAPESRALFLRDRHNIIKQTVLRNENFSPPAFAGRDRTNYLKVRLIWCARQELVLTRLKTGSLRRLKTYLVDPETGFSCLVC
jgi:hypothetical protein